MAADPYTAFFGGVGQGVGKGLGNAMSDAGNTSNTATSATYGTQLGGTGWTINFGPGNVESRAENMQTAPPPTAAPSALGSFAGPAGSDMLIPVVAAVAMIGLALVYRMSKGRR